VLPSGVNYRRGGLTNGFGGTFMFFFFFFLDGVVRCSDREEMTQEWNLGPESNLI